MRYCIIRVSENWCAFLDTPSDQQVGEASLYLSGIVGPGEYDSSRTIGGGLVGETAVNGSGLVLLGSERSGNRSLNSHGVITGNMSVRDLVRYEGVDDT